MVWSNRLKKKKLLNFNWNILHYIINIPTSMHSSISQQMPQLDLSLNPEEHLSTMRTIVGPPSPVLTRHLEEFWFHYSGKRHLQEGSINQKIIFMNLLRPTLCLYDIINWRCQGFNIKMIKENGDFFNSLFPYEIQIVLSFPSVMLFSKRKYRLKIDSATCH